MVPFRGAEQGTSPLPGRPRKLPPAGCCNSSIPRALHRDSRGTRRMSTALLSYIRRDFDRVPSEVVRRASAFAASILADVAGRRGTLAGRIAPLTPSTRLAGTAFTIEV